MNFRGWTNAHHLQNDTVEVTAVPEIGGRVMHYGFVGGSNIVREVPSMFGVIQPLSPNWQYVNYGGCKLWAAPQSAFPGNWPPNAYWENGRNRATAFGPLRMQLSGPREPGSLMQFTRSISLAPTGSVVTLDHLMENVSPGALTRSIWAVNQQPRPSLLIAPRPPVASNAWGSRLDLWQQTDTVFYTSVQTNLSSKLFVMTERPWCAGLYNRQLWIVWGAPPAQMQFPPGEAPVEVYFEATYSELEILSPAYTLAPGATAQYTMYWSLTPTADDSLDAALAVLRAQGFIP